MISQVSLEPRDYAVDAEELLTPTLTIHPESVRHNIRQTIRVLGGQASRWRPHLKTVKLASMMRLLVEEGVQSAKCATTLELLVACEAGFKDVLVAYGHTGANARRVAEIASAFPEVRVSAVVDVEEQIPNWRKTPVSLFIDVNSGMDRTGMANDDPGAVAALARQIEKAGIEFRGLHFYDGHANEPELAARTEKAHKRYRQLMATISSVEQSGPGINEVITTGTPALPAAISFRPFAESTFRHQVSPGTVVYNDTMTLAQLPEDYNLRPAVIVVARVVSHPLPRVITCDAGHKSVSVDCGVPNCIAIGEPSFAALKPSEEHLPIEVKDASRMPAVGSFLYLIPRHVCPTVNNFDRAALVSKGSIISIEEVSARGREGPFAGASLMREASSVSR